MSADAMHRTFGYIRGLPAITIEPLEVQYQEERSQVSFKLTLPAEGLPGPTWVLQHLVGIVAGDLVPSSVAGCEVDGTVLDVVLGRDLEASLLTAFRSGKSNDIKQLRGRFNLTPEMPLLGYAFKPRAGAGYDATRRVVLEVLAAGFNYVVLDTRNTEVTLGSLDRSDRCDQRGCVDQRRPCHRVLPKPFDADPRPAPDRAQDPRPALWHRPSGYQDRRRTRRSKLHPGGSPQLRWGAWPGDQHLPVVATPPLAYA